MTDPLIPAGATKKTSKKKSVAKTPEKKPEETPSKSVSDHRLVNIHQCPSGSNAFTLALHDGFEILEFIPEEHSSGQWKVHLHILESITAPKSTVNFMWVTVRDQSTSVPEGWTFVGAHHLHVVWLYLFCKQE